MKERRQAVLTWIYLAGISLLLVGLFIGIPLVAKQLGYEPIESRSIYRLGGLPDPYNTGGPPWALVLAILALLGGSIWLGRWAMRNADD